MFDALVNGRIDCGELTFEVAYYDIEELNRRAEAGETDVSKISYALLPEIQSRYTLLDSGSALGRGNGPVFVARQGTPPDSIRRVAVPGMHTTANALMSRLYPSITQKKPVLFSEIAPAVRQLVWVFIKFMVSDVSNIQMKVKNQIPLRLAITSR